LDYFDNPLYKVLIMMRIISVMLFMLVSGFFIQAQKVKVVDKTNLEPLAGVVIYSVNASLSTTTNVHGEADVSSFRGVHEIRFRLFGYLEVICSYAQLESQKFKLQLTEKPYSLDEVVVSASRFEEKRSDVPQQIQVLKSRDLQFMNQVSTSDLLQSSGNVMVQKSQLGGGSPIIRGFEANKVLIVVDGVRMNNAIFRGGHLQNVITLDNSILDRTEIVFGPGSVVYGSDALGGVMHFYTKKPMLGNGKPVSLSGNAFTRYSTAANENTGHVDFNLGMGKIAFLSSITVSDMGDLRQGGVRNPFYGNWGKRLFVVERINGIDSMVTNTNVNLQRQSGYKQYDFLEKVLFQPSAHVSHVVNFQYSTSSNINRYDRLTEVTASGVAKHAQWYYGPQERLFVSYSLMLDSMSKVFDHVRAVAAWQDIAESRHNRTFRSNKFNHRQEKVGVLSLNLDFSKEIGEHELRYGAEVVHNKVTSSAFQENISTGKTSPLDTRYPDGGSTMQTLAAYVTHAWEITPRIILSDGMRYSHIGLSSSFNDKSFFPFPYDEVNQKSDAVNGNVGLAFMPGNDWRFTAVGSTGFRAPNVDDLSKVFESVPGSVIVPNPDLKPEYTYNAEIGLSKTIAGLVRTELSGYYTRYTNAITTAAAQFNGSDSIVYDGQKSRVMMAVNEGKAFIYGLNGTLQADITHSLSIHSTLNYTIGRIRENGGTRPLDHIPPVFGKTSLNLSIKKFRGEFFTLYHGWKRLKDYNLLGEDNQQYATKFGTPAWLTLNLRTAWQINQSVQLQMALENILDQNYRVFASGISAPGRNFSITLRGRM
jgi:hemoglobin/transferrin/lactoferrin receptor protein